MEEEPRVRRLGAEEVEGDVRALFDRFLRSRGNIPNLFRVAAQRPPIVRTLEEHMRAVMGPGEVPQLLKELLSVRVSQINLCDY